jgi:FtsZ-interacting cell division protein ZipA
MSRSSVWLITVTALIVAFLSLSTISLMKKEKAYAEKEKEAARIYEQEVQKSKAIDESAEYIKSEKYVEDEAVAKLHMGYPETTAPETLQDNEADADAAAQENADAAQPGQPAQENADVAQSGQPAQENADAAQPGQPAQENADAAQSGQPAQENADASQPGQLAQNAGQTNG